MTIATLCGAARFRDGLLSILDSGIEILEPESFPASWTPTFAVRIDGERGDVGQEQEFDVSVTHDDGEVLAHLVYRPVLPNVAEGVNALSNHWVLTQSIPMQIRREGTYHVGLVSNGDECGDLRFLVVAPPGDSKELVRWRSAATLATECSSGDSARPTCGQRCRKRQRLRGRARLGRQS